MKCPTCGYIGFETSDRCRNCGYEFALATPAPSTPDLSLREDDDGGPLQELAIKPGVATVRARSPRTARGATNAPDIDRVLQNLDRVIGAPEPPAASADLPLFEQDDALDLPPMVDAAAEPRRPLSVRRATPDPARLRPKPIRHQTTPAPQSLELPLPEHDEPVGSLARTPDVAAPAAESEGAPPLRRVAAALIDVALLVAIDLVVISFTLKLCGLTTGELSLLPPIPIAAFFLLVNGGYLAAFTAAGGQTIGKMALGLKVVGHADLPVSPGLSVLRALGCVGSLLSLGIGFVPAVLNEGGRALEDRLADTRVVRISA
jgi:uncharacterized RDD family membrane protein YckC